MNKSGTDRGWSSKIATDGDTVRLTASYYHGAMNRWLLQSASCLHLTMQSRSYINYTTRSLDTFSLLMRSVLYKCAVAYGETLRENSLQSGTISTQKDTLIQPLAGGHGK